MVQGLFNIFFWQEHTGEKQSAYCSASQGSVLAKEVLIQYLLPGGEGWEVLMRKEGSNWVTVFDLPFRTAFQWKTMVCVAMPVCLKLENHKISKEHKCPEYP
jgi:hypothetical protein